MFIPVVIATSLAIALVRGGRFTNLAQLELRYFWLLFVPLLLQIIAFSPIGDVPFSRFVVAQILYILSLAIAAFALWLNRHLPGIRWIAFGLVLNCVVIVLNGGYMPVSATAREFAGLPAVTGREMNVIPLTDATILPWLSDVLPLPSFLPFANVFSIGDVLIAVGAVLFTQRALVPPKPRMDQSLD